MHLVQALQADNANRNRIPALVYRKDDLVYVSIRNWGTDRDAKKLDFRFLGLYRILKVLLYNAYYLELLPDIQKYPVFYSNLLRRADNDLLLGQISPTEGPPLLIHVERDNRGEDKQEVQEIIEKALYKPNRLQQKTLGKELIEIYKVKWIGYDKPIQEPSSYLEGAIEIVDKFYARQLDSMSIPPSLRAIETRDLTIRSVLLQASRIDLRRVTRTSVKAAALAIPVRSTETIPNLATTVQKRYTSSFQGESKVPVLNSSLRGSAASQCEDNTVHTSVPVDAGSYAADAIVNEYKVLGQAVSNSYIGSTVSPQTEQNAKHSLIDESDTNTDRDIEDDVAFAYAMTATRQYRRL